MSAEIIKIEDFGWDDYFESKRTEFGSGDFSVARVVAEYKGAYKVKNENGEYAAKITGKQIFKARREYGVRSHLLQTLRMIQFNHAKNKQS